MEDGSQPCPSVCPRLHCTHQHVCEPKTPADRKPITDLLVLQGRLSISPSMSSEGAARTHWLASSMMPCSPYSGLLSSLDPADWLQGGQDPRTRRTRLHRTKREAEVLRTAYPYPVQYSWHGFGCICPLSPPWPVHLRKAMACFCHPMLPFILIAGKSLKTLKTFSFRVIRVNADVFASSILSTWPREME